MRLRADIGEVEVLLADWWQEFSMADDNLRQDLVDIVREEQQARPKSRGPARVHTRKPRPAADAGAPAPEGVSSPSTSNAERAEGTQDLFEGGDGAEGAPKKRRRRRRSGAAKSGSDSQGGSAAE
jgi:poly(A) polymerase